MGENLCVAGLYMCVFGGGRGEEVRTIVAPIGIIITINYRPKSENGMLNMEGEQLENTRFYRRV